MGAFPSRQSTKFAVGLVLMGSIHKYYEMQGHNMVYVFVCKIFLKEKYIKYIELITSTNYILEMFLLYWKVNK